MTRQTKQWMTYWERMYAIVITPKCANQIAKLCRKRPELEVTLRETLRALQEHPFASGKRLSGYTDYIRCWVGYRHRIVYRVIDKAVIIHEFAAKKDISYS